MKEWPAPDTSRLPRSSGRALFWNVQGAVALFVVATLLNWLTS